MNLLAPFLGTLGSALMPSIVETVGNLGKNLVSTVGDVGNNKINSYRPQNSIISQNQLSQLNSRIDNLDEQVSGIQSLLQKRKNQYGSNDNSTRKRKKFNEEIDYNQDFLNQ